MSNDHSKTPIKIETVVSITATIKFNEGQLKALDAMAGYGADAFLKVFYEKLGTSYMRPHEANLRSLFSRIAETVPEAMGRVKEARKALGLK